jgi:hypothetical protein
MKIRHAAAKQRSPGRGRTKSKIAQPRAKTKKASKPPAHLRKESSDSHDTREWFAADPSACISNPAAQKILRQYEHPYRYWTKFPGKDEENRIRATFEKPIRIETKKRAARSKNAKPAVIEKALRELAERDIRKQVDD